MTKLTENWAVINENGGVEYTAYTKTMCHDHINDAGSMGLKVECWVVREIGVVGEQGESTEGDRDELLWSVYEHVAERFDFNKDPVLDIIGYLVDAGIVTNPPTEREGESQ